MSDASATATLTAGSAAAAPPPWFAEADDETKGFFQTRGLDRRTAPEAAIDIAKSYRELVKMQGVPADQLLRLPPDLADTERMKPVWARLGVPADPAEYDFSAVKAADGSALPDDMVAFLRATAAALATPKDRAPHLADALLKRAADAEARAASAAAIESGQADLRLRQNWGANYRDNLFYAERFMARLGLPAEIIDGYKSSPHYDKIMEGYRAASAMTDEATLIGGAGPSGQGQIRTKEQAISRMSEIKADTAWVARWRAGGTAEINEFKHLNAIIAAR